MPAYTPVALHASYGAGVVTYIQPPAGETWMYTRFYTSNVYPSLVQAGPVVTVDYFISQVADIYQAHILIDNTNYLKLAADATYGGSCSIYGLKIDSAFSGVLSPWVAVGSIAAGAAVTFQPPVGELWVLKTATQSGGNVAYIKTGWTNGTINCSYASYSLYGSSVAATRLSRFFNQTNYCRLLNTDTSTRYYYLAGFKVANDASRYKVSLVSLAAGTQLNIQPPADETWAVSTAEDASNQVALEWWDGASWQTARKGDHHNYIVNNTNYLRFNNGTASAIVVGYCGVAMKN